MTTNPFSIEYSENDIDDQLIKKSLGGSKDALEALISRHQAYIYNIAQKMVTSPEDAEDLTQEVLIIVITKLSQFKGKSQFRTWLYQIVFRYFLRMKQRRLEGRIKSFDQFGMELDAIPDQKMGFQEKLEKKELIEELKIGCMSAMLLCLDREQRLVFILGRIFKVDHTVGSELMGISRDSFRQKLSRARKDLFQFMDNKCGLINRNNSCRCHKKTKGFIKVGLVNKKTLRFNADFEKTIRTISSENIVRLADKLDQKYSPLYEELPFQEKDSIKTLTRTLLKDSEFRQIFNL